MGGVLRAGRQIAGRPILRLAQCLAESISRYDELKTKAHLRDKGRSLYLHCNSEVLQNIRKGSESAPCAAGVENDPRRKEGCRYILHKTKMSMIYND